MEKTSNSEAIPGVLKVQHIVDAEDTGKKRKQVKKACVPCRKSHSACNEERPCSRCIKLDRPDLCTDIPNKKRAWTPGEMGDPYEQMNVKRLKSNWPESPERSISDKSINFNDTILTNTITSDYQYTRERELPQETQLPSSTSLFNNYQRKNLNTQKLQNNSPSIDELVNISKKLFTSIKHLQTELRQLKNEIVFTREVQTQVFKKLGDLQKQTLFLLHQPCSPLEPGNPAIATWSYKSKQLLDCNPEFEKLLKCSKIELLKRNFSCNDLFPEFFAPLGKGFWQEMAQAIQEGKEAKVTQAMVFNAVDGEEVHVKVTCQPLFGPLQQIDSFIMYVRNHSKVKV